MRPAEKTPPDSSNRMHAFYKGKRGNGGRSSIFTLAEQHAQAPQTPVSQGGILEDWELGSFRVGRQAKVIQGDGRAGGVSSQYQCHEHFRGLELSCVSGDSDTIMRGHDGSGDRKIVEGKLRTSPRHLRGQTTCQGVLSEPSG